MPSYACPRCGNLQSSEDPSQLVCSRCGYGSPSATDAGQWMGPPGPTYGIMQGAGPPCPRCYSTYTQKGGIPTWAIVTAIVTSITCCLLGLFFLLAKDETTCMNCGLRWK